MYLHSAQQVDTRGQVPHAHLLVNNRSLLIANNSDNRQPGNLGVRLPELNLPAQRVFFGEILTSHFVIYDGDPLRFFSVTRIEFSASKKRNAEHMKIARTDLSAIDSFQI